MAEAFSRISAFFESAKEIADEAAGNIGTSAKPGSLSTSEIQKLLNSRSDRNVLTGLKYVTSLATADQDASEFFADVVKNVASPNMEARQLVYSYLIRYADREPDLALLSINTIQKSLGDKNPHARAIAIRVMSAIRVVSISGIVTLGIQRCVQDMSPIVRRAAALAIINASEIDPSNRSSLLEHLPTLLGDADASVVGSAFLVFVRLCPDRYDILHSRFRHSCRILPAMDQWSQLIAINVLTRYYNKIPWSKELNPDMVLFLETIKPLLCNSLDSVAVAVATTYFYLAPEKYLQYVAEPLACRIVQNDSQAHVLELHEVVVQIALKCPHIFAPWIHCFFILPNPDSADTPLASRIYALKLEMISLLCTESNISTVMNELGHYIFSSTSVALTSEAVKNVGRIASKSPEIAQGCLNWLLKIIKTAAVATTSTSANPVLLCECVPVIRYIVQLDPDRYSNVVVKLASLLVTPGLEVDEARSSIIWLVGELGSYPTVQKIAPDILKILAKNFMDESETCKHQILLLAAKLYSYYVQEQGKDLVDRVLKGGSDDICSNEITLLFNYIILLARYDVSFDLRDRARLFKALLADPTSSAASDPDSSAAASAALAALLLQARKPRPKMEYESSMSQDLTIGTASQVLQKALDGYYQNQEIPDWATSAPGINMRDDDKVYHNEPRKVSSNSHAQRDNRATIQQPSNGSIKLRSLDDFFAETPAASGDVSEEEEEEEEEDEDEEEEDEDDEEEEEAEEEEEEEEEEAEEEEEDEDED
ncbi:hypothetical protein CANCADRAFT_20434, partial [Tortispora caseinolytica NRRL Y-17796]